MTRVMRPEGRVLIADMIASEDPDKAAYHNRMERLCDPTHVCALPLSAFENLFSHAGLAIVLRPTSVLHYDVGEWIAHGGPCAADAEQIVSLMEASTDPDRSGLNVRRENGTLRFSHTAVAFVLRRG